MKNVINVYTHRTISVACVRKTRDVNLYDEGNALHCIIINLVEHLNIEDPMEWWMAQCYSLFELECHSDAFMRYVRGCHVLLLFPILINSLISISFIFFSVPFSHFSDESVISFFSVVARARALIWKDEPFLLCDKLCVLKEKVLVPWEISQITIKLKANVRAYHHDKHCMDSDVAVHGA